MSKKALKFGDIVVNKKEFQKEFHAKEFNEMPKEINHYICFTVIFIDSVLRADEKNYPQVYLEQCKYKAKTESQ